MFNVCLVIYVDLVFWNFILEIDQLLEIKLELFKITPFSVL